MKKLNGFTYNPYNKDEFLINEQLKKQASQQLASFVYLQNTDESKYGSTLKILNYQKSFKNYQYPKTILEATNVLINHRYDESNQTKQKKVQGQNNDKDEYKN